MGTVKKIIYSLIILVIVIVVVYFSMRAYVAFGNAYSWKDMDWNQDGSTSLIEFIESSDIGKRSSKIKGQDCAEYFALKDGLPIKIVCPYR